MNMPKQKIFYDANFAINEHRGMGKYINSFVNALKEELPQQILKKLLY